MYSSNHFEYSGYGNVAPAPLTSICAPAGTGSQPSTRVSTHASPCHRFIGFSSGCRVWGVSMRRERDGSVTAVLHRCDERSGPLPESISDSPDRLDPRLGRPGRDELRSQPGHVHVERARLDESALTPPQVTTLTP